MSQDKHRVKTAGEKKFDFLTYTGINYIANVLLSVGAVYWVERTHGGQSFMKNFVKWVHKNTKVNPETAELLATKSFFLTGGFAVLLPVKWMEDAKVNLVKKWNREIYGPERAEQDPQVVEGERAMEAEPKQGWASIISSRVLSLIPFYLTVGLLWDRKSTLSKATNPELGQMSKGAIKSMENGNPAKFSQIASKGFYADKPISAASRWIGKQVARLTGDTDALKQLEKMDKKFPGMIKSAAVGGKGGDPIHSALPYYFISEAITSGAVAAGMYGISRVTGPYFGGKPENRVQAGSVSHEQALQQPSPELQQG